MLGFKMPTFWDVIVIVVITFISITVADAFQWPRWLVGVVVLVVALVAKGLWIDFRANRHYRKQSERRRQIIRGLYDQNDSLDHIALVLSHSGFKDEDGKEIGPDEIKAEYDAILVLDEFESEREA